jgi:hypothetical protein
MPNSPLPLSCQVEFIRVFLGIVINHLILHSQYIKARAKPFSNLENNSQNIMKYQFS